MAKWTIPVTWMEAGTVSVIADTLEEAIAEVENDGEFSRRSADGYVAGSFEVSVNDPDYIRSFYNDNRPDDKPDVDGEPIINKNKEATK